jgi:hypothetical protein
VVDVDLHSKNTEFVDPELNQKVYITVDVSSEVKWCSLSY